MGNEPRHRKDDTERYFDLATSTSSTASTIFSMAKFVTGVRKVFVRSNLIAVHLFTTRINENLAANMMSTKAT